MISWCEFCRAMMSVTNGISKTMLQWKAIAPEERLLREWFDKFHINTVWYGLENV